MPNIEYGGSLESAKSNALERAQLAWPELAISPATFFGFVADRLRQPHDPDAWTSLHAADLYLACGCALRIEQAAADFVAALKPDVDGVFRPDRSDERVEDFRQGVFEYLLVPAERGATPRIGNYRGSGKLRYWVRVIASRRLRPTAPRIDLALLPGPADPPETAYLREYYRKPFEAAVREAFSTLGERERTLLRYQLIDRMPIMAIAAMLGVHRVSVSRWLGHARAELLQRTRALMCSRFRVPQGELSSVVRLARGALDVSAGTMLGAPSPVSAA